MVEVLTFLLAAFGVIYVITESLIFLRVRMWIADRHPLAEAFVYCAYCVGFWVGAAMQLAMCEQLDRAALRDAVLGGALVMGAIATMRAVAPSLLTGAWARERSRADLDE